MVGIRKTLFSDNTNALTTEPGAAEEANIYNDTSVFFT
jgi:hypothetical protein